MLKVVKKDGFSYSFDPNRCKECGGRCCIGESGHIWVTPSEIKMISKVLALKEEEFINRYLVKIRYRYSLKELSFADGFRCIFFDTTSCACTIYSVRPQQCRTFPFWNYFKNRIEEVKKECPGILV